MRAELLTDCEEDRTLRAVLAGCFGRSSGAGGAHRESQLARRFPHALEPSIEQRIKHSYGVSSTGSTVGCSPQSKMDQTIELLRVGVAEEDEIFRRGLIAVLREEDWDCIVLATDGAAIGEGANSAANLDIAVVCAKVLGQMRLPCPIVCLAEPKLYGAEDCHSSANVKAILPHENLSAHELVVSIRAAVAGLQVESPGLSRQGDAVLDARRIRVLRLLAEGADTRAIAGGLQLSERTVKTLVPEIELSLGATTRAQAVAEGPATWHREPAPHGTE